MRWLEGPAPHGAGFGINRYLYRVYNERADLAVAYPFLDGPDGSGFAGWVWVFGVVEMEIPERFLPPAAAGPGESRARVRQAPAAAGAAAARPQARPVGARQRPLRRHAGAG